MADVLSSGPDTGGPPRARRRRTGVLAGVLVTAGAAYLAVHAGGGGRSGPPRAAEPSVQVRPAPAPMRTGPLPPPAVFRLDGEPGVGPAGARVLIGGREPGLLDAHTGRLTPLAVAKTPGDVAEVDRAGGTTTVVLHNANRLRSAGVLVGPTGRVVKVGQVLDLVPLRDGGAVAEDCDGAGGTGPCTLTAYAANGARRWDRTVARQLDLVRDTPYGLLVRTYQGDVGGVVRLEDARLGGVRRVIGRTYAVLGADDERVVFLPAGCGSDCELTLTDLATGASRFLPENPGSPMVAAFSADGRRLAIGYAGLLPLDPSAAPERDGYVVVIDLPAARRWRPVPGITTGDDTTALPVWSPDGRLLLVVPTDGHGSGRVVAWTPGAPRVTILPVGLSGFYGVPGLAVAVR